MNILLASYRSRWPALSILIPACGAPATSDDPEQTAPKRDGFEEPASPGPSEGTSGLSDAAVASKPRDAELDVATGGEGVKVRPSPLLDANTEPGETADGSAEPSEAAGLPCDIHAIVSKHCGMCHGDPAQFGAPMSLTSDRHFHAAAVTDKTKEVHELVKMRVNASSEPMPPPGTTTLSESELSTLNDWLDRGAPAGDETCTAEPSHADAGADDDIDVSGLECYKFLTFDPGNKNAKFKVGAAVDTYYLFGFQAPWQGTVYAKVMRPLIDNSKVLHHWQMYREEIEDGSVTPTIGGHPAGELVHSWAPGAGGVNFLPYDDDVGLEMPATTYSLEVHYNSSDPSAEDASGAEICVQKQPTKNVATLSWLGHDQGGVLSYATGLCLEPSATWTGTCAPQSQEPIHILLIAPHMHQLGRHLNSVIDGPTGSRVLYDGDFEFSSQRAYEKNELLMPGETITTTCSFSQPMCVGTATTQEMCYLLTWAYPKYALADDGFEGALSHGQGACLGQ